MSPWLRHFAFPVCFILLAVQWPYRIEHGLTQGLMRTVAGLTVEIVGWFNIPAFQHGNLIELSTGVVGIDEACSGIRSFQSTLMAALFLGELYRLKWPWRWALLGGGIVMAFCFNVVRTLILTWEASAHGLAALEKWHDPAGLTILAVCFVCLWGLALWLRRRGGGKDSRTQGLKDSTTMKERLEARGLTSEDSRSQIEEPRPFQLSAFNVSAFPAQPSAFSLQPSSPRPIVPLSHGRIPLPRFYLAAIGCWAILVLGLKEAWYWSHETKDAGDFHWSADFPTNNPTYAPLELSDKVRRNIRSDVSEAAEWTETDGTEWTAYFFRWNPGPVRSMILARLHRPDVCLPASGFRQVADAGLADFKVGNLELPFRRYTYGSNGQTLHVFFCQWEDGSEKQSGMWSSKGADRIRAALVGRRHLGQQTFEIILSGYDSLAAAETALRNELPSLVAVQEPAPNSLAGK